VNVAFGSTEVIAPGTSDPSHAVHRRIGTAPGSRRDAPGDGAPTGCRPSPLRSSLSQSEGRPASVLLDDYHRRGDRAARERLIAQYLPLVRAVARRYAGRGEPLDDLVQVGAIGLMNAIDRFDRERGADLAAFAIPTVAGEIRRHLRDRVGTIRMPRTRDGAATEPAPPVQSLSSDAGGDGETAAALPAVLEPGFELGEDRAVLERAFRVLDRRERRVLQLSFFAGLPQSRIGRELGISQIHVSRVARRALEKLRTEIGPGLGAA
jgi:RNA polymerase sigma-B factor